MYSHLRQSLNSVLQRSVQLMSDLPETHLAVRLYPDQHLIKVESIPIPKIEHPDDAIVKINLAGLCGSDLHGYRGHEPISSVITTGHEFVGELVALGSSFLDSRLDTQDVSDASKSSAENRPLLYSALEIGDKVVSPFTSSCGECHFCRVGFTARCVHQLLFGSEKLPGGQAQYVRVPKAGGTLFKIPSSSSSTESDYAGAITQTFSDTSLLLLADILPTGCFAALQALRHPKVSPLVTGKSYRLGWLEVLPQGQQMAEYLSIDGWSSMESDDRKLTMAIIGLGPVGICATISLLDILSANDLDFQVVAIDLNASRRDKVKAIYDVLPEDARGRGIFAVASVDEGKSLVEKWTSGVGCNAVLEIVGNPSALTLSYSLIRPFGVITSVGVHQSPPVPFTGRELYDKNVSLEFGRCPVRTMFPMAVDLLRRRQDVFGGVGLKESLMERVVSLREAPEMYNLFDKGECGKVVFDPWV